MNQWLEGCVLLAGLGLLLAATPVSALQPMEGVEAQAMTVVIEAVEGMVQVRASEDAEWQKAQPGMELTQGAEFRTGPRSKVQFSIPPDQTVVLDRLGTMKVLAAIQQADKVTTELGVTYGRTRYDIEAGGGLEHESTIRSPSATLAVRGTSVIFSDQAGFPATAALSRHNIAGQRKDTRSEGTFTSNESGRSASLSTGAEVQEGAGSAAESMASATQLQPATPGGGGRQEGGDNDVVARKDARETNRGAFDGLPKPKLKDTQLSIRTTWSHEIADIDNVVRVVNTTGGLETLASSPATLDGNFAQRTFTGLRHQGDNTGSPDGGEELIVSTKGAVVGEYDLDVVYFPETGTDNVTYTVEVFENGNRIGEPITGTLAPGQVDSHKFQVTENGQHEE